MCGNRFGVSFADSQRPLEWSGVFFNFLYLLSNLLFIRFGRRGLDLVFQLLHAGVALSLPELHLLRRCERDVIGRIGGVFCILIGANVSKERNEGIVVPLRN